MFRATFASWTVSGVSMVKGFFSLSAQTTLDLNNNNGGDEEKDLWSAKFEKILQTSTFSDEEAEAGPDAIKWMADPLTDKETREANADSMRVRMELMILRVQKEFCRALENEENPKYKFLVRLFLLYLLQWLLYIFTRFWELQNCRKMYKYKDDIILAILTIFKPIEVSHQI